MRSEGEKGSDEVCVFERFLSFSGLPIPLSSVEKRLPPEPDLLCTHDVDGRVAFELVELCDSNLARAIADPRPDDGGIEYIRTTDPSSTILERKLNKKYVTHHPVELLCYTSGRIVTPADIIKSALSFLLVDQARHAFRRVWLMTGDEVQSLWTSERLSAEQVG